MRLVGVGDNVVDRYLNLKVMYPGGNAVNVAAHAALLGEKSAYLGRIAEDTEGKLIKESLCDLGVDLSHCEFVKDGTTKKCDVNVYEGEREFVKVDLGKNWPGAPMLKEADLIYLDTFDVIHSSCNAHMEDQIALLKRCHGVITYDFSTKDKYRTDDYLKKVCPYLDLALFSCDDRSEEEQKAFAREIHAYGAVHVLITDGDGQLFYNGSDFIRGAIAYVEPLDTMGAGDSYLTACVRELVDSGWQKGQVLSVSQMQKAMEAGKRYAAQNCLRAGGYGYPRKMME